MSKTMPAVVFHGEGRWGIEKIPQPVLESPDDVLLEVDRAGICGTDLHILETPPGHPATPGSILGHEYVATVAETGSPEAPRGFGSSSEQPGAAKARMTPQAATNATRPRIRPALRFPRIGPIRYRFFIAEPPVR